MSGDLDPSRRLYAEPDVRELLDSLPALATQLQASLGALQGEPSASRCTEFALTLYGVQTHVQRLRTAIERSA